MISLIFIGALLYAAPTSAATQNISAPGLYALAADIVGNDATANTGTITINASNITLDLNGHTVSQGSGISANVHGIECAAGVHDVVIKNGIIRDVSGNGIRINDGCANITLDNLTIIDCASGHILASGSGVSEITGLIIQHCSFTETGTSIPDMLITLTQCNSVLLDEIVIQDISSQSDTLSALLINDCSGIRITNCIINGISVGSFAGITISSSVNTALVNCAVQNSQANNDSCIGYVIQNGSNGTALTGCTAHDLNATTSATECAGFTCDDTTGCTFSQCSVRSVIATAPNAIAYGFKITDSNHVVQKQCSASLVQTTGSATIAYGILWSNVAYCALIESICDSTRAATQAFGMLATTISESELNSNQFLNTIGGTLQRGLRVVSATRCLFTRNIAFRNGTNATQQIEGLPSGTTDFNTATGNISSIGSPWTNLRAF